MTSVAEVVSQINAQQNDFLLQGKDLEQYAEALSSKQKKELRKLLTSPVLQKAASPDEVARYALDLANVLFGQREVVDRWILEKPSARVEKSDIILLQEQVLREGLIATWRNEGDPTNLPKLRKASEKIWTFMFSKRGEQLTLASGIFGIAVQSKAPVFLPRHLDRSLSPELLYKVIRDGYKEHKEDVRRELGAQSYIEAWNTFRRIYQPIIMALFLIIFTEDAWEKHKDQIAREVNKLIGDLKEKRELIEKSVPELKKEQARIAYEAALVEFTLKWGEGPTPDEDKVIRSTVSKGLGVTF